MAEKQDLARMHQAGVDSLAAAKQTGIDHRTVKAMYAEFDRGKFPSTETATYNRLALEAARLLAWPVARVSQAIARYRHLLVEDPAQAEVLGPKPIFSKRKRSPHTAAARFKDLQRYLGSYGAQRSWPPGAYAVHAVQLEWWQHDRGEACLQTEPTGELTSGWLLLLGNRHCRPERKSKVGITPPWTPEVQIAIIPGIEYDRAAATALIADQVGDQEEIRRLHLVCDTEGHPTATVPAGELQAMMPKMEIVADPPTIESGRPFRLAPSFPHCESVEHYLDVLLECREIPPVGDEFWSALVPSCRPGRI